LNHSRRAGENAGPATSRIYKQIGVRGLRDGLPVRIVITGTLTALQWIIYDSFKIMVGIPNTGGAAEEK
jgi:solute carrier family 25 phosphate transporter 3